MDKNLRYGSYAGELNLQDFADGLLGQGMQVCLML